MCSIHLPFRTSLCGYSDSIIFFPACSRILVTLFLVVRFLYSWQSWLSAFFTLLSLHLLGYIMEKWSSHVLLYQHDSSFFSAKLLIIFGIYHVLIVFQYNFLSLSTDIFFLYSKVPRNFFPYFLCNNLSFLVFRCFLFLELLKTME